MKISRDFIKLYMIPVVLVAGMLLTIVFTVFYTGTTRTEDGRIVGNNWAREFTLAYAQYLCFEDEVPEVLQTGTELLEKYGLWFQMLDDTGREVVSISKPVNIQNSYKPYELLQLYQYGTDAYSVFVSHIENQEEEYTYLIGFPLNISKVTMYIDAARYHSGRILIIGVIVVTFFLMIVLTLYYNVMLVNSLTHIREALRAVAARKYFPDKRKPFLKEVYEGIDLLNEDIGRADALRVQDETAREEWLANITHDLITTLAPIRGYAEILSDGEPDADDVQRYGQIILKNSLYVEQLVDDLKLTYQLQSNSLPLNRAKQNMVRLMKEVIIDLLNTPDYEVRDIEFETDYEEQICSFDDKLMRRALTNVLVNSLKHNSSETKITVHMEAGENIRIQITDNGKGMSEEELKGLFKRYYRGTNTETRSEGTGLGMAIARQIIEAHDGQITAESKLGLGTGITIIIPK